MPRSSATSAAFSRRGGGPGARRAARTPPTRRSRRHRPRRSGSRRARSTRGGHAGRPPRERDRPAVPAPAVVGVHAHRLDEAGTPRTGRPHPDHRDGRPHPSGAVVPGARAETVVVRDEAPRVGVQRPGGEREPARRSGRGPPERRAQHLRPLRRPCGTDLLHREAPAPHRLGEVTAQQRPRLAGAPAGLRQPLVDERADGRLDEDHPGGASEGAQPGEGDEDVASGSKR